MIEKIKLNNGIEMPMEGFGVFQIPEEDCEPVVRNAIAEGYRLIDTASSYQNEEAVGRGIRNSGIPREELFITTKAYIQQMGYDNTRTAFERTDPERNRRKIRTDSGTDHPAVECTAGSDRYPEICA